MDPITKGAVVNVTATLKQSGIPFDIEPSSNVSAQVTSVDGLTVLISPMPVLEATAGSNWNVGVIVIPLSNAQTNSLPIGDVLLRVTIDSLTWLIPMEVVAVSGESSALFPNSITAIATMRRDGLMIAAQNHFAGVILDDDLIWSKLRAAESEVAHALRVPLTPTAFFPHTPTQTEIDALGGMPWAEDPAYDFDPEMFQGEQWGFIATRNKPIVSVQSLKFIYPAAGGNVTEFPTDWLRMDKKYGQIRIVPTAGSMAAFAAVAMFSFSGQRLIPHMVHVTYVAGINAARDYPELIDAVKKLAVLKLIEDGFPGQSGSISADGLSQSISVDMDKYHESVDRILNGAKGNGGLMAAIHGIRMAVM